MRARALALVLVALAAAACDAASNDPGYGALIQIPKAQLRPGPFPAHDGGPAVVSAAGLHATIAPGSIGERYRGALAPGATAVIVGVEGDDAAWIVRAGTPDVDTPALPSFDFRAGFGDALPPGPFAIDFAAADETGRIGPVERVAVIADPVAPPTGMLVVTLSWEGPVDLDLHVVDPTGGEAWSGDPNTWDPPPPGTPPDPDAWMTGGILDRDANARCVVDAHPREDVAWQLTPPAGTYTVRVDTRAMCGGAVAYWYVTAAAADGTPIASARGVSTVDDISTTDGDGAGLTAMTFTRP